MNESLIELKVIVEYFDSLFNDFEKEKQAKKEYEEKVVVFNNKLNKMNHVVDEIFSQIDEIKNIYDELLTEITFNDIIPESVKGSLALKVITLKYVDFSTFRQTIFEVINYADTLRGIQGQSSF